MFSLYKIYTTGNIFTKYAHQISSFSKMKRSLVDKQWLSPSFRYTCEVDRGRKPMWILCGSTFSSLLQPATMKNNLKQKQRDEPSQNATRVLCTIFYFTKHYSRSDYIDTKFNNVESDVVLDFPQHVSFFVRYFLSFN